MENIAGLVSRTPKGNLLKVYCKCQFCEIVGLFYIDDSE